MGRLFFALMFAVSVHAAFLSIKINTSPKSENLLKSEPIKIAMFYREVKKTIKKSQPEIIESKIKKREKKSNPPVKKTTKSHRKKQFESVKKRQLAKTIKESYQEKEIEPKPDLQPALKQDKKSATPALEQKIINPEQESGPESPIKNNIEKKDKSSPQEKEHNTAVIHTLATPKYKTNPKLEYPRIAKKRGYHGKVLLLVVVSKTGAAKKVLTSKSSGYRLLDKAAREAVSQWQFYPGTKDGKPVEMSVEVPIRFDLK